MFPFVMVKKRKEGSKQRATVEKKQHIHTTNIFEMCQLGKNNPLLKKNIFSVPVVYLVGSIKIVTILFQYFGIFTIS